MITLTKENVKEHCRTCLVKLNTTKNEQQHENYTAALDLEGLEENERKDTMEIHITAELQHLIIQYIEEKKILDTSYPQSLCFVCFNKLQSFEIFRKRAQECARKLHLLLNNADISKFDMEYENSVQESKADNSNDDFYKILLKGSLMETESILLDSCAAATLATVEMHDPDPFDTTVTTPRNIVPTDCISAIEQDWQEKENSNDSMSNNSTSALADEKYKSDTAEEYKVERKMTRLRSRKNACNLLAYAKLEKKKRRTKKEMEEWRREQTDKIESKIKRRNKGTKNNFKCTQCNHCFAHKITLDAHIRKVHEGSKRPFQCDRCEKAYTFIGGLYTHIKEIHETEVRSYACDYPGCDRLYTSFIAMQKHKRLKHTELEAQKKYVCEQCGATFNQTGNLKYHRRTKHPTEAEQAEKEKSKERFECTICNKLFHSRYTLKYHTLQLHTNDMKYECNVCGRRMAKKFMLVQHMLVHSTDKMPCEHCGKQFIRKFELEAHIRAVHMKLKPFECQYCSECFASRKTLRHHEYIHTGEKPYVCDICGQAYRQQTCLKNHRKSHEKLSAEALLAANINRTLMNTLLGPQQSAESNTNFN